MARDGSGNYNLPAGQPVSTGTTISSTVHNTLASDVASALTQSLSKDGQTTPTANLPMGGFKFTGVADGTASNHFATVGQLQSAAVSLAGSVSGTDTITANLNPAITSYTSGLFVSFIVANTNATTTPTLALNGLSAKTIVRSGGQALAIGDLVTTKLAHMQYDGTNFVLINPATATYPALIPTGSTVPANGMYLSAANTVAWASNTTLRGSVNSTGNWVFAAPSSGIHTINGLATPGSLTLSIPAAGTGDIAVTDGTRTSYFGTYTSGNYFGTRSAHASAWFTNNLERVNVSSAGNVVVNAPSSGVTLLITGLSTNYALQINAASGATGSLLAGWNVGLASSSWNFLTSGTDPFVIGTSSTGTLSLYTNSLQRIAINSAGNVTINAPSSGTALTIAGAGASTVNVLSWAGGTTGGIYGRCTTTGADLIWGVENSVGTGLTGSALGAYSSVFGSINATSVVIASNSAARIVVSSAGNVTINAPSSGASLALSGVSGSHSFTLADAAGTSGFKGGFLGIPQNSQSANYTCVLADAGKHILHPSAGGAGDTFTIPANGSVAYDVGTTITFVNADSNSVSIAITTDTLTLAGTTTTGTRTLGQNGVATAIKVTSTGWVISGTGLT